MVKNSNWKMPCNLQEILRGQKYKSMQCNKYENQCHKFQHLPKAFHHNSDLFLSEGDNVLSLSIDNTHKQSEITLKILKFNKLK